LSTDVVEVVVRVHGGVKFYRGAANAARAYVERDRSRADDYYLGEGVGVATRLAATPDGVEHVGELTGDAYEEWVAGIDIDSGKPKGRLRKDPNALRFVEVTVNGPKTWPLPCIRRSPRRWTPRRTGPPPRSSAGLRSTRRPGQVRVADKCRCRSRRSRRR